MQKHLYLTGMSGAGKSTVLDLFKGFGAGVWYTGNDIPEDHPSKILYGVDMGPTKFIERARSRAMQQFPVDDLVVIDSIRSRKELDYVRSQPETCGVAAVICGYQERIRRIRSRDSGKTMDAILYRDNTDLGLDSPFEVGSLIALADYYINMQEPREHIKKDVENIYREATLL